MDKDAYNKKVTHPMQSWEWGEFREQTGIKVVRKLSSCAFSVTIHKIPHTNLAIGYVPKSVMPDKTMLEELKVIGQENRCIFIKLEPNVIKDERLKINDSLQVSPHPLFTKYTFQLDITKSEEELLKNMHPKTRYNIRVAQKRGVIVEEDNSDKAFEWYIKLMKETTTRQKYYAHTIEYHRKMWATLKGSMAHLLVAKYEEKPLTTWILFTFNNVLYYPYGASTSEHREVMASNLMMWEAIKFGQKANCKNFDMWGSLGPNPDPKDPWYGFHRFKLGYGAKLVEFIGSYDYVLNSSAYQIYNVAHRARWAYLRVKKLRG
jgi:lipid II:glycine glycyltransferase (peptidoglycan interpeptide bridge formation enzyme)